MSHFLERETRDDVGGLPESTLDLIDCELKNAARDQKFEFNLVNFIKTVRAFTLANTVYQSTRRSRGIMPLFILK